jgi:DNA invertase Pin-like site-specific DNA recombinase
MTRRLAAVPNPLLRDGVYIRVSAIMGRSDERFLSPEIQREAIDRARGRGPASRVVDEWRDIDVSTARVKAADRPGLQAALAAAKAGDIDRLWVLTLDRFDRDTAAMRTFDEVSAAGVELWAEAGRIDVDTAEGYLSTTMQLAIARYQRDRIGKAWKQTHEHRVARGLPHSGKPKWGYVYDVEQRLHVPDPATAPVLADLYARYTAGETVYALVRWLNDQGVMTLEGNPWSDRSLRRMLDSGFAAGLLAFRGDLHPGVHTAVITAEQWAAFQAARAARRVVRNTERSQYLLSGLVRCTCGSSMTAGQFGSSHEPKYRCKAAKESGRHPGGYVMARYVEAQVLAWVTQLAQDVDAATDAASLAMVRAERRRDDASLLEAEVSALDEQLLTATKHLVSGVIDERAYELLRADSEPRRADLQGRVEQARSDAARATVPDPGRVAANLLATWDLKSVPLRRAALASLIRQVTVTPGRPRALVEVVPVWG